MSATDFPFIASGKPNDVKRWLKAGKRRYGIKVRWQAQEHGKAQAGPDVAASAKTHKNAHSHARAVAGPDSRGSESLDADGDRFHRF